MDFLLLIFELFFIGVTAEALRANIDWKSTLLHVHAVNTSTLNRISLHSAVANFLEFLGHTVTDFDVVAEKLCLLKSSLCILQKSAV